MKTLSTRNVISIVGKIMLGLVLVTMLGSINLVPAFGDEDHRDNRDMRSHDEKNRRKHGHGRYEHRDAGYDRDAHGRRVYKPYGYAPPPVIYAPTPPPGISIFFPPIVIPIR